MPTTLASPSRLIITFTTKCNLRCVFCNHHYQDVPGEGMSDKYLDMPEETWLKVLELIPQANHITLAGVGEPLACRNAVERIRKLRELSPQAYILLFTNGMRLSDRYLTEDIAEHLSAVHVSVDAWDHYIGVHVGGSRYLMESALSNLDEAKKASKGRLKVQLGFVCMGRNLPDVLQVAQLIKRYEFDSIVFKDLQVWNPALTGDSLRHNDDLAKKFRTSIEQVIGMGIPVVCEPWPELSTLGNKVSDPPPELPCYDPWNQANITATGEVRMCCFGNSYIGSLNEHTFQEIWMGPQAEKFRETMVSGQYLTACSTCRRTAFGRKDIWDNYRLFSRRPPE